MSKDANDSDRLLFEESRTDPSREISHEVELLRIEVFVSDELLIGELLSFLCGSYSALLVGVPCCMFVTQHLHVCPKYLISSGLPTVTYILSVTFKIKDRIKFNIKTFAIQNQSL